MVEAVAVTDAFVVVAAAAVALPFVVVAEEASLVVVVLDDVDMVVLVVEQKHVVVDAEQTIAADGADCTGFVVVAVVVVVVSPSWVGCYPFFLVLEVVVVVVVEEVVGEVVGMVVVPNVLFDGADPPARRCSSVTTFFSLGKRLSWTLAQLVVGKA